MDTTTIHHLESGQTLRLWLRRGDRLWMQQGSLQAEPPAAWLGDQLLRRQEHWSEGRLWTADASAAWQCRASRPATLCVQRRVPWWSRWAQRASSTGTAATSSATPEPVSSSSTMRRNASSLMPM